MFLTNFFKHGRKGAVVFVSKVLVVSMLCGCLMTFNTSFAEPVYGYSATVGNVNVSSGRAREDASVSSDVAFCVSDGDQVAILSEKKDKDGKVWYKVKVCDSVGYIRSDLVSKTDKKTEVYDKLIGEEKATSSDVKAQTEKVKAGISDGEGVINGNYVRIRSEASTSASVKGCVSNGQIVKVLETSENEGRTWLKVELIQNGSTVEGYIAGDFVKLTKSVTDTAKKSDAKDTAKEDASKKENDSKKETDDKEDNKDDNEKTDEENSDKKTGTGEITSVSVKGFGVRVRKAPTTGDIVAQLDSGHPLEYVGESDGSDGFKWINVKFSYLGKDEEGFVRSDLVNVTRDLGQDVSSDKDFEKVIAAAPESYKNQLRTLHNAHPNWEFEMVDTGLEWEEAVSAESKVGKNLVSKFSVASWKSTAAQAYSPTEDKWYTFDGGSWVSASSKLIAFFMDPRNFLDETGIYQFETLSYKKGQTAKKTKKVLANTFMTKKYIDTDGEERSYPKSFVNAGKEYNVSPYLLAARCVQEQGVNGSSPSVTGREEGYEGIYNFFNVGAYAYGGKNAPENGLIYASTEDEESLRPWNSQYSSILGGAKYLGEKYISKGQDTLYFQKFNVVNTENGIYSHQYMNSLLTPSSEASRLALATKDSDEKITFRIPFYKNMPDSASEKPVSDSSPNNYLKSLKVDGYELTPAFLGGTENYTIKVDSTCENITISAEAVSKVANVGGTGSFGVEMGSNTYYVACKAQNGDIKMYTITVTR